MSGETISVVLHTGPVVVSKREGGGRWEDPLKIFVLLINVIGFGNGHFIWFIIIGQ